MRRSIWTRVLAVLLIISMLAAPVSAAGINGNGANGWGFGGLIDYIWDIIRDIIDDLINPGEPEPTEPIETTPPTVPEETTIPTEPVETEPVVTEPEETEPVETQPEATEPEETEPEETEPEETPETVLNLVEGYTNTENGYLLRGATYTLSTLVAQEEQSVTAPYALRRSSVSTMSLNNSVALTAETAAATVSGTALVITTDDLGVVIPDGDYAIYSSVNQKYMTNVTGWSNWSSTTLTGSATSDGATAWTFTRQADGSYTIQDPNDQYLNIERENAANLSSSPVYMTITQSGSDILIKKLNADNEYCYLNALGNSSSYNYFGGWSSGSPITLYAVTSDDAETPVESKVVYFPVTMFNYDQDVMRSATNQKEVEAGLAEKWNGIYFSGGSPAATSYTYTTTVETHSDLTWQQVMDGTYYADEACTKQVTVTGNGDGSGEYTAVDVNYSMLKAAITGTTSSGAYETSYYAKHNSNFWYTEYNGNYYPVVFQDYDTYAYAYYYLPNGTTQQIGYPDATTFYVLYTKAAIVSSYTLTAGGETLATLDGTDLSAKVGITLYSAGGETTVTKEYAAWNWWSYNVNGNTEQNKFYAGLVQNTLLDDQIVFNVLEAGIFNEDNQVKDIYEFVGLPFVLDTETGVYSFNSDDNGVYFKDTDGDGDTDPASGTREEPNNLYFDRGNTQGWSGMSYGDGSTNLWAPYNTNANDTGEGAIDYHFGMRADLPFSMTPNGRIKSTDDESDPITFTFQGDDDVWIYIDGNLVIDLGGIHNRLGATVDFAANTITYFLPDSNNKKDLAIGSYNTPEDYPLNTDGTITKKLFNDADGEGVIKMTRDAFAADIDHEMQVFYLERGKGTSNCRIEFNLPMKDEVIITKDATQSWSEQNQDDEDEGVDNLTAAEQAIINNIDFGFTLYKKTAGGEFAPVANTNFYLEGTDAATPPIRSTNEKGHFTLKNGQSARFVTEIPAEGVTYYVVEDAVPDGFVAPDFNFAGTATGGFNWTDGTNGSNHVADASAIPEQIIDMPTKNADGTLTWAENKSYEITVYGSIESTDTVEFTCSNYLDAELPNPTALAYEDIIVIDYGLPVDIDPLANDVFRGDSIEIIAYGGAGLTLAEPVDKDGDGVFEEDELEITADDTFESGTVVFNGKTYRAEYDKNGKFIGDRDTFTYTLNKQLTEVEVLTYIIKVTGSDTQDATGENLVQYDYAIGKVYIVPATIMYYEENFADMITFTGSNWVGTKTTDGASARQEPGVVGTVGDSTYGSDAAYLTDSYDSNGTSYYADTTNGAVRFQYTFIGTGTTIFARTSATTGYVQFKLYEGTDTTGTAKYLTYRDTYWKDENLTELDASGTLYNIPIYTQADLPYGTYTVVATVAKAGTPTSGNETGGAGKDFWLDGIRIMQPLNEDADMELTDRALDAYADDGESNLDVVTLRQKLITDAEDGVVTWDGTNFVVMTDIDDKIITAEDYTSIGPKEEVYLTPGQKVSFSLKYWKTEGLNLYIGMKAPFGNAKLKVGQSSYTLLNASDCYYDVTTNYSSLIIEEEQGETAEGYLLYEDAAGEVYYLADDGKYYDYDTDAVYTGTGELSEHMVSYYVVTYTFEATEKIVSLTNIKVVGNYEFTIVEDVDINIDGDAGETENP